MSLVNTLAQEFRINAPQFDKFELRITEAGAYSAFKRQAQSGTSWLTPELVSRAYSSIGHTVKIPVIDYKDVTIRSTRPLTIAADENTSQLYTVSWTTYAYGFKMYPALFHNNEIGYQRDFDAKFKAMLVKLMTTLDSAAVTALDAAKSQVIGEVVGGHTFASNVVSETAANLQSSYILHDVSPMMSSNDYMPFSMDIVGNQGVNAIARRLDGFGQFNSENKALQFDGKNFHFSNNISNALNKDATGYAIADGALGMLTRVERDSLYRTSLGTSHQWDTVVLPGLDLEVGTYYYEEAVDASAVAGAASADMTRTGAQVFDFAVDVAFITPYNSDLTTVPSSIIKFDVDV